MLTKAITAVTAAAIIFSVASASAAKDGGPPTIDIQKTCRENINALRTVLGIGQDTGVARDQLVKDWATYRTVVIFERANGLSHIGRKDRLHSSVLASAVEGSTLKYRARIAFAVTGQ